MRSESDTWMIFVVAILMLGIITLFIIILHDAPIDELRDRFIQMEYIQNITPNTTGIERIDIARMACINGYNNKSYSEQIIIFDTLLREDIIDYCVQNLILNS